MSAETRDMQIVLLITFVLCGSIVFVHMSKKPQRVCHRHSDGTTVFRSSWNPWYSSMGYVPTTRRGFHRPIFMTCATRRQ